MSAAAYRYADGDLKAMPREYEIGRLVDRFGVHAVYDRLLGVGEMRRIMHVEAIVNAYQQRAHWRDESGALNMADWSAKHPAQSRLLNEAMKAASDGDE